ncbi:MAG: CYTH domain-containing protein [Dissulfurispiraceae bacterium]|jgi:adenylate cyclase class IV
MIISEKESKLLIDNQHGQSVINSIKNLEEIDSFRLSKNIFTEIEDAYFDLNKFELARMNSYLRIRGRNDGHFITIRNRVTQTTDEVVIDELTHPLDTKGLEIALASLAENVQLNGVPKMTLPHFSEILESIGLKEVLRVHIERVERDILLEDVRIGKMKMDIFHYLRLQNFGPFFEIEVDSYKKIFHKSAADFFSALSARYDKVAQISGISKYIRGINITYGLTL